MHSSPLRFLRRLVSLSLLVAAAPISWAQLSIMPMGDSITAGGGAGQAGPGYRGVLYNALVGENVSFTFSGVNTNANGPTNGLPSLPAGAINHNGYGSYTLTDLNSNLAANGSKHTSPNNGGFWITGGNPTTDVTGGAINRPAVYPDVLLLMAGTNDADYSNGTGLAAMQNSMHSILTWFNTNRPNTIIIAGTVVPWNKYGDPDFAATNAQVTSYNAWLKNTEIPSFLPKYRVVDMNPLFKNADGTTNLGLFTDTSDGIHPNSPGYTLMGETWNTALLGLGVAPKWAGDGAANVWSTGGPTNFRLLTGSGTAAGPTLSSVAFASGNPVYFDDGGANPVSLSGTLSPQSVTVNATQPYTFAGTGSLSGAMVLTKNGPGSLTLVTDHSFTGGTMIKGGTLQVGAGGAAGSLGTGPVTNSATLAFNRSDAATFANVISGTGAVQQIGSGTTVLTGTSDFSGVTTISSGALQIGNGGTAGSLGTGTVIDQASLVFNRSDNVTFFNAVSGSGSLTKLGAATLTLAVPQSYTGATLIAGGTLRLQNVPPLLTTGLLYRLSADAPSGYTLNANGLNVDTFKDLSGNGRNFVASGINGPTVLTGASGINGRGVLRFDGMTNARKLVQNGTTSVKSIFIVNRPASTQALLAGIWGQNGPDLGIRMSSTSSNAWQYAGGNVSDYVIPSTGPMWINGVPVGSTAQGVFPAGAAHLLGASNASAGTWTAALGSYWTGGTRPFAGDIGEVLAYSAVLSTTDRQSVEAYLNYRWFGVGGSNGPMLSSSTALQLTQSGAAFDLNGLNQTVASLSGVTGSKLWLGGGILTLSSGASTTFAGAITDAGGFSSSTGGSLSKGGSGTLTLSGASAYSGATQVTGGVLKITGSLNNGTATITVGNSSVLEVAGGSVTASTIRILAGGTLRGTGTINANVINDTAGTVSSSAGQNLVIQGNLTNAGLLQLTGGAALQASGTVTNNGVLDLITGSQTLPAGLVNNGTILVPQDVRVTSTTALGTDLKVTLQSYIGHGYQLQRSPSLTVPAWQDLTGAETSKPGTGQPLELTDLGGVTTPAAFYRVKVEP